LTSERHDDLQTHTIQSYPLVGPGRLASPGRGIADELWPRPSRCANCHARGASSSQHRHDPDRRPGSSHELSRIHALREATPDRPRHVFPAPFLHSLSLLSFPVGFYSALRRHVRDEMLTRSRVTLMTGKMAHNHNVTNVFPPYGKRDTRNLMGTSKCLELAPTAEAS
jgi:hypothetical protein